MKLVFISDKVCWPDDTSPTGYATVGGFPFQMNLISRLFDQTRVVIMERKQPAPSNLMPITGHNLSVHPFKEPPGENWTRKITILLWLIFNVRMLWMEIKNTDAMHINVPGDLGGIAILLGFVQRKRMFIRHCGTWNQPVTLMNHALIRLLEKIADQDRNIVMATGWDEQSPSKQNPHITWIFSTTLTDEELLRLPEIKSWVIGNVLNMITVGRLTPQKNMQSIIGAVPLIKQGYRDIHLTIVGDGPFEKELKLLVVDNKVDDIVSFTGNLDHVQVLKLLKKSHVFVFPTRVKEGFPKALLEAMACGLPSIATSVSVIPHLLQNGSGILLQDTSAEAVAQAVLQLISEPGRMRRMGQSACQAARGYTLEAWGREIQRHLEKAWGPLRMSPREM